MFTKIFECETEINYGDVSLGYSMFVVKKDGSWEHINEFYDNEEGIELSDDETEIEGGSVEGFIDYQDLRTWFKKVGNTFGQSNEKPYEINDGNKVTFEIGLINRPCETQNYLYNVETSKLLRRLEQPVYDLSETICGSSERVCDDILIVNVFLDYDEVLGVMDENKKDLENGKRDFIDDLVLDE